MVLPDLSKMDLQRLLHDIPKYKPWLSSAAWKDWEAFLANADQLSSESDNSWNIHKLVSVSIIASAARSACVEPLSETLQEILAKETTLPPKVR